MLTITHPDSILSLPARNHLKKQREDESAHFQSIFVSVLKSKTKIHIAAYCSRQSAQDCSYEAKEAQGCGLLLRGSQQQSGLTMPDRRNNLSSQHLLNLAIVKS